MSVASKEDKHRSLNIEIVVIFDVKMPKRMIQREILPNFKKADSPSIQFYFFSRKPALIRPDKKCDNLSDDDLIRDIKLRYARYWRGKLCIFFTTDQGVYDLARGLIRKSPLLLVSIPLCGKSHFSRRAVGKILKRSIVPLIKRMRHKVRELGAEKAQEYFRKRPLLLRPPA